MPSPSLTQPLDLKADQTSPVQLGELRPGHTKHTSPGECMKSPDSQVLPCSIRLPEVVVNARRILKTERLLQLRCKGRFWSDRALIWNSEHGSSLDSRHSRQKSKDPETDLADLQRGFAGHLPSAWHLSSAGLLVFGCLLRKYFAPLSCCSFQLLELLPWWTTPCFIWEPHNHIA